MVHLVFALSTANLPLGFSNNLVRSMLDDLCIDIWISAMIICLSIQIPERQGTAMYYIMIVVTRNIDITFCRVFHTLPDFPDKIFTLVVVVVPLILGPP